MENLLEIAKQILSENPNTSLTGSLMLKLRGFDLGREIHDIDILICDHAPCIKFPIGWNVIDNGFASDGSSAKYKYNDIVIDVISDGEQPEIIDGIPLGRLDSLLNAKYLYSTQNNPQAQKHKEDLIKIGYKIPEIYPFDITDLL